MKIYITGGSGLVGSNVLKVAVEGYQARVFATMHHWQPRAPTAYEYGVVDVNDRDQVLESVRAFEPEAIVHCAALLDLALLYDQRELGWQVFVESTRYLTEAANEVGAKMILLSSDWVFDGTQTMADETTPPNPINYYGVLKVVGETLLSAMGHNWAVARIAGVNGVHWARPELPLTQNAGFGNLAPAAAITLRAGQPFTVWQGAVNMRGTPTLASEIGEMVLRIIEKDCCGIFHCCGAESATRLELVRATAEVFGLDQDLIQVGAPDPVDPASLTGIPVPTDTSLSQSYTTQQLGYTPSGLHEALERLRQQMAQ
ncbi:MAG: sugar nucleotide-binding protein [Anaerolineae bacterium]|jgi:dTDP-4-dehydrorhamnose reductase